MPRTRRFLPENSAVHIMCRGNNKQNVFNSDKDKMKYYLFLCKFKEENKITIFHYSLMPNHIHLIIWVKGESSVSKFMKQVNLTYFTYYKETYNYCGHLWQGRFKSNIIDSDTYLLQCGKYIELNPVRAGLVIFPEEYKFSSYNYYSKGKADLLITPSPIYLNLHNSEKIRREKYIDFVVDKELHQKLLKQNIIGSDNFIKTMEDSYGIKNTKKNRGRPKSENMDEK